MKDYQICIRCIMDTTDPNITFDSSGTCSHCQNFDQVIVPNWVDGKDNNKELSELGDQIRQKNKQKKNQLNFQIRQQINLIHRLNIMRQLRKRQLHFEYYYPKSRTNLSIPIFCHLG